MGKFIDWLGIKVVKKLINKRNKNKSNTKVIKIKLDKVKNYKFSKLVKRLPNALNAVKLVGIKKEAAMSIQMQSNQLSKAYQKQ